MQAHDVHGVMASDLLGRGAKGRASGLVAVGLVAVGLVAVGLVAVVAQQRAPDPLDDMGFSRAGQGLMISTVTVASP